MTIANEPLLSAEQRARIECWLAGQVCSPPPVGLEIGLAMKEIARLTSQVEALAIECACLSHDRLQEVERHLIERAVSEERGRCAALAEAVMKTHNDFANRAYEQDRKSVV